MNKRDQIQKDALTIALNNKRCGLGISMGVGKTLIGLNYIAHLQGKNMGKLRVLVVAPKLSIFDSWRNDASKFGIDIENIEFTTYLSLNKYNPQEFDIVVLDECHSLGRGLDVLDVLTLWCHQQGHRLIDSPFYYYTSKLIF
jgi:superfamily II DNA or RNA helicase